MQQTDEFKDVLGEFYVEKKSRLIYEVKFFQNFVLVRPAAPALYLALKKLSYNDFTKNYEEYLGNPDEVREQLEGAEPELIIEG
jgi:hypothetical protein